MADAVRLSMAFIMGVALGFFFFRGLWLTLRMLPAVRRPGRFMAISTFIRMLLVIAVFVFFTIIHWTYSVFALIGFVLARQVLTGFHRRPCRA